MIARLIALGLLPALLLAAAGDDAVDRVAAALSAGTTGSRAGRRLAAATLRGESAHPLDGIDRAAAWGGPAGAPYRDRALGPGYRAVALAGRASFRLDQIFLGGRRARVVAVGAAPAAFTLAVSDETDRRPCPATATGRSCDWVPDHTARFGIDLTNTGKAPKRLFLVLQ